MKNIYGEYNVKYNNVKVILPTDFTFSPSDKRLPRVTHCEDKSYSQQLSGSGYTPIAFVINTGGGFCRFTLTDTTGGQNGIVEVSGSYNVKYYSHSSTSKLYMEHDSTLNMVTLYLQHSVDNVVTITVEASTRFHDLYRHSDILYGNSYTKFTPVKLNNPDTLTAVSATSY